MKYCESTRQQLIPVYKNDACVKFKGFCRTMISRMVSYVIIYFVSCMDMHWLAP